MGQRRWAYLQAIELVLHLIKCFPLSALDFDDKHMLSCMSDLSLGTGCFLQQTSDWNNTTHMSALTSVRTQTSSAPQVLCFLKINFLEMKQVLTAISNKMPSEKKTVSVIFSEFYSDWCCQCTCAISRNQINCAHTSPDTPMAFIVKG